MTRSTSAAQAAKASARWARRDGAGERDVADAEVADAVLHGDRDRGVLGRDLLGDLAHDVAGRRVPLVVQSRHAAAVVVVAHDALERHDRPGGAALDDHGALGRREHRLDHLGEQHAPAGAGRGRHRVGVASLGLEDGVGGCLGLPRR